MGTPKGSDVLEDFESHAIKVLENDSEIEPDLAEKIAGKLREYFRIHWGGQTIYFTKRRVKERDHAILSEFNGFNQSDLARKHDLSIQTVYQILRAKNTKRNKN